MRHHNHAAALFAGPFAVLHDRMTHRFHVLVLVATLQGAGVGAASSPQASRAVALGTPVRASFAAGEAHTISVDATTGTLVKLMVEGAGALIRVRIDDACGARLFARERRGGEREPIVWLHIVTCGGMHAVRLESLETEETPHEYVVSVLERRPAEASDQTRVAGFRRGEAAAQLEGDARRRALEDAATHYREARDMRGEIETLVTLARVEQDVGRSREAAAALERALAGARALADATLEGRVLLRQGLLQAASGQPEPASRSLQSAIEIFAALGDRPGQAEALTELASLSALRGDNDKAAALFGEALTRAREAGDRRVEAIALNTQGVFLANLGNNEQTMASYQQALAIRRRIDDRPGIGQTLANLAVLLRATGDSRAAIARYEEALTIRRVEGPLQGVAVTLHNLGVAWADLGEYDRALTHFRESLAIMRSSGARRGEGFSLVNIGQAYGKLGDAEQALSFLSESLPVWREQGDRRGEVLAHLGIAGLHLAAGAYDRATESGQQALRLAREASYKREVGQALATLANVDVLRGQPAAAIAAVREAIELARGIDDRREEARALVVLGAALTATGSAAEAVAPLRRAIELLAGVEDRAQEANARAGLADALAAQGDRANERRERLAALELIESLRGDVGLEGLRVSFFASKRPMYERAIRLLMSQPHDDVARADEEAFQVSERARARALLDLLTEGRVDLDSGAATPVLGDLRRSQELISTKALRLTRLLAAAKPGPGAVAARRELDQLLARHEELRAELRTRRPDLAAIVQPEPITLERVRRDALDDESVLVEYWLGERGSYVWAITATGTRSAVLPARAQIERLARRAYDSLSEPGRTIPGEDASATRVRVARSLAAFSEDAAALSRLLLSPIARELTGKRTVFVAADGALQFLPFAALPAPGTLDTPLVERHQVVAVPSASVLLALKRRAEDRPSPRQSRIFVMGDPVFSPDDPRVRQPEAAAGASTIDAALEDFGAARLARLRFSREEARRIAALAPGATTLALDFGATRQRALGADLRQYGIIHFAAHALVNDRRPLLSGIALSLVDEHGRPQNGFVRLNDIYTMPLAARLVVLSACDTALGRDTPGEGLVGLARGFLHAGANGVIASLWAVDDRASATLMGQFYERLLSAGRPPAAALREAQQAMRTDAQRRHPYFWAPWVLIGT
jgi:CHAT domain-containing protein/tetratricopeptide (TPR) repeat protein